VGGLADKPLGEMWEVLLHWDHQRVVSRKYESYKPSQIQWKVRPILIQGNVKKHLKHRGSVPGEQVTRGKPSIRGRGGPKQTSETSKRYCVVFKHPRKGDAVGERYKSHRAQI